MDFFRKFNNKNYRINGLIALLTLNLLAVSLSAGCGRPSRTFTRTDFVMDTVLGEKIYGRKDVTEDVKELLSDPEKEQLSWREAESTVARVNQAGESGKAAQTDETFAGWVNDCLDLARKSGGAFDPTIGTLTRLWDIEGDHPKVPAEKDINRLLAESGYGKVHVEGTKILMDSGVQLDLGAVGKGIGCDEAAAWLAGRKDVTGAVISIGGSIVTYGEKPDGSSWSVGIQDPRAEDGVIMGSLTLKGSHYISTSGDYEKYFEEDGVRYHHILDPATGYPADNSLCSVTVVCDSGLLSDGLSTACFVLGREKALKLLQTYGAEGVFIEKDGKVTVTKGLEDSFRILEKDKYTIKQSLKN